MDLYCTYIVIYRGNLLPPFYIGSTSIEKINNGYYGTVKSKDYCEVYKNELKHNKHLFDIKILTSHKTRKEALQKENMFHRKLNVVKNCLYINKMYASGSGLILKGDKNPFFGKKHTEETKINIGKHSKQRMTSEQARKIRSKASPSFKGKRHTETSKMKMRKPHLSQQGSYYCTNGHDTLKLSKNTPLPEGFYFGRTMKTVKNRKMCNNGVTQRLLEVGEKLPEGYKYGILKPRPQMKKICKYCNKNINLLNYNRWHGDKCKNRISTDEA